MKISTLFALGVSFAIIFTGSMIVLLPEGNWLFLGILVVSTFILGMLFQSALMEDALDPDNYHQQDMEDAT